MHHWPNRSGIWVLWKIISSLAYFLNIVFSSTVTMKYPQAIRSRHPPQPHCWHESPPPQAPDSAIDPDARLVPFTILPTPVLISLTPQLPMLTASLWTLIYQLQCSQCNAFYTGETCHSLSDHVNGHHFTTTVSNPDLPVAIHTQSHQIPFQDCWSISVIHKLPDPSPTTFAVNWKQHTNSSFNHVTPPNLISINPSSSTLAPAALIIFCQSFLFHCWRSPQCRPKASVLFQNYELSSALSSCLR